MKRTLLWPSFSIRHVLLLIRSVTIDTKVDGPSNNLAFCRAAVADSPVRPTTNLDPCERRCRSGRDRCLYGRPRYDPGNDIRKAPIAIRETDFDQNKAKLRIATGALARRMNFKAVDTVILYQLPSVRDGGLEGYMARVRKTGWKARPGESLGFVGKEDGELAGLLVPYLRRRGQQVPQSLQRSGY